jgi:hypothetical protein
MRILHMASHECYKSCIKAVGEFVAPILRGIQESTGLHMTLLMGGPIPEYGGELRTIQYVNSGDDCVPKLTETRSVSYSHNRTADATHWP